MKIRPCETNTKPSPFETRVALQLATSLNILEDSETLLLSKPFICLQTFLFFSPWRFTISALLETALFSNRSYNESFHKVPFCNVSFRKVPFRKVPFRKVPFRKVPFRKVPFRKVPFRKVPFRKVPFCKVPFRKVPFCFVLQSTECIDDWQLSRRCHF